MILCYITTSQFILRKNTHTHARTHTHTHYYGAYTQPLHAHSTVNQANERHDQLEQSHYYDTMDPSTGLSPSTNKASGISTSTGEDHYYSVIVHANGPKILTSQNVAYGDIPTSTTRNDEQVNEWSNIPG